MSKDVSLGKRERPRYHHGDLRRHLLQVAREEIALHGAQSVSLSSLARLAGVSQPAPYRHFADREALLEGVAAEAFGEFSQALADAIAGRVPHEALNALSLAYVAFGQLHTEVYRLMFASRLTPRAKADGYLDRASGAAFSLLRTAIAAVSTPERADDEAYRFWGQLHGLIMLKADGFITSNLEKFIDLSEFTAAPSAGAPGTR